MSIVSLYLFKLANISGKIDELEAQKSQQKAGAK